ncbi:MAG: iron chelate uptake ABC transporter family permease subunit, partial [Actinobacteria bacterium]|nr:iron chelate uptake ABC transporter family permease subunit [Actinomycetota bacterium]
MKSTNRRLKFNRILKYVLLLVVVLALLVIVSSSIGSANLGLKKTAIIVGSYIPLIGHFITLEGISPQDIVIISQIRLPRIFIAIFVGIALASSGVVFQGVFRNPIADPFIIGVSAGASFGATLGILFTSRVGIINISYTSIFAFLGAIGVTFVVYSISRIGGRICVLT